MSGLNILCWALLLYWSARIVGLALYFIGRWLRCRTPEGRAAVAAEDLARYYSGRR